MLGDPTTHGGVVSTAAGVGRMYMAGNPVACVGDLVVCPLCNVTVPIIEGATGPNVRLDGKNLAREGDKTACGAILVSVGQSLVAHNPGDVVVVMPVVPPVAVPLVAAPLLVGLAIPAVPPAASVTPAPPPDASTTPDDEDGDTPSTATDLTTPATPGDAPETINLSGMQSDFDSLWNNSFPGLGGATEHGGTIVSDASGNLSIVNTGAGTSTTFSPDLNVGPGQTAQGVFHTHPYNQGDSGISLSGGDAAALINDGMSIEVVQSGSEQFMYMRTAESPAYVNADELNNTHNARIAQLQLENNMSFSDASKIAARETAQAYGLAYYEGSNGVLRRVYP